MILVEECGVTRLPADEGLFTRSSQCTELHKYREENCVGKRTTIRGTGQAHDPTAKDGLQQVAR